MNIGVKIFIILFCSFIMINAIKRIITGRYNYIDICIAAFYGMQVLPMILEIFLGVDDSLGRGTRFYQANTDEMVDIVYGLIVVLIMLCLIFFSHIHKRKYIPNYEAINLLIKKISNNVGIRVLFSIMMFCPIVLVLLSPNPMRYLTYTTIWKINSVGTLTEQVYHNVVMYYGNNIALMAIIISYVLKKKKSLINNMDIVAAIMIMSWADGKRVMFIMAIVGIIFIDIVKKNYEDYPLKFINKIIVLCTLMLGFFFLYGNIVGKLQDSNFLTNYTLYLGRMSSVKVSIYDMLHQKEMLEYPGQTILFDLFFYIPRSFWENKPSMFTQYFTAYAINSVGFASWNLHVNIWAEMIANFGIIWGCVISVIFSHFVFKISVNSGSFITQMTALGFVVLYYMFGFEILVMLIFVIWLISLILSRFKIEDNTLKFIIRH